MAEDERLEHRVGRRLAEVGLRLAVAESCTGGLVAQRLTSVPGSSAYFAGGVVAYADDVKERVLGIAPATLRTHGAVSAQTALAMAHGVRRIFGTDVAVAVTGIAGPGGGTAEKPVGLSFIAAVTSQVELVERLREDGDREHNRRGSADAALKLLLRILSY